MLPFFIRYCSESVDEISHNELTDYVLEIQSTGLEHYLSLDYTFC